MLRTYFCHLYFRLCNKVVSKKTYAYYCKAPISLIISYHRGDKSTKSRFLVITCSQAELLAF